LFISINFAGLRELTTDQFSPGPGFPKRPELESFSSIVVTPPLDVSLVFFISNGTKPLDITADGGPLSRFVRGGGLPQMGYRHPLEQKSPNSLVHVGLVSHVHFFFTPPLAYFSGRFPSLFPFWSPTFGKINDPVGPFVCVPLSSRFLRIVYENFSRSSFVDSDDLGRTLTPVETAFHVLFLFLRRDLSLWGFCDFFWAL